MVDLRARRIGLGWIGVFALVALVSGCSDKPRPAPAPDPSDYESLDQVPVAKVGDAVITRQELEYGYKRMPKEMGERVHSQGLDYFLDVLIEIELGHQEALARGIDKEPEVADKINRFQRQFLFQEVMDREAPADLPVREEEIRAYYDSHPEEFRSEALARAKYVVVRDEVMAQKVLGLAKGGADFDALIAEYSVDPDKEKSGGQLDWFRKGIYGRAVDAAVFSAKAGDIVGPVQTPAGFQVVLIQEIVPSETLPFEQAKPAAEEAVKQQKAIEWKDQFMAKLREKFPVTKYSENMPE